MRQSENREIRGLEFSKDVRPSRSADAEFCVRSGSPAIKKVGAGTEMLHCLNKDRRPLFLSFIFGNKGEEFSRQTCAHITDELTSAVLALPVFFVFQSLVSEISCIRFKTVRPFLKPSLNSKSKGSLSPPPQNL